MSNKIKILFIHHAAGWSGAAINMINIIRGLDKSKYSINVLLIRDSIVSKMLIENGIHYAIAKGAFYEKFYSYFIHSDANTEKWYRCDILLKHIISWILSRLYFAPRELKKFDYDIVHLNSSFLTDWLAPGKAKGKVIIHVQEPFSKGYFGLRHYLLTSQMRKYADQIIAISQDNAKRINIPGKTQVIYNFIELRKVEEIYSCSPKSGKVLYLGGSEIIKGFFAVVDSLDYLDQNIKIVFCGNYSTVENKSGLLGFLKNTIRSILPVHKKLKKSIEKIKNHPKAIFVGLVKNTSQIIQESEFLISPFSSPHFARPVIEAHLHKKAVIGSDVEGMDEIIEHGKTGLIVPRNNPKALAAAINELFKNDRKAKYLGEAGYNVAITKFTQENLNEFERVYDKVLSEIEI